MFMPWYIVKRRSNTSDPSAYTYKGLTFQPYIYNNVTYDYETTPDNYLSKISGTPDDFVQSIVTYTSTTTQNNINLISKTNYSGQDRRSGFPSIAYSKNPITNIRLLVLDEDREISGRFKLKNIVSEFPYTLAVGCTIPIKVSINNNNFKYMVFGNNSGFTTYYYYIGETPTQSFPGYYYKYIGGYNTPAVVKNRELSQPSDYKVWSATSGSSINVDFGTTKQILPKVVYDWFIQNFDRVYENTYTIKSTTGSTLTTLTEAPPMISATLSAVGNAKYLTLKGENNTNYTMEWTSETPQGKIFAGLATSKGGSIVIPVGETSTINLTDSTDLYEVWQTYRPPTTTFDINLYKNSAEPNKVDKTAELSTVGTISGVLRQECSLINPEIIIQYDKPPDFNYCYIANFGRYYYVENIVSMRQNLWRVRLRCDVLMTYKTQILNLTARIARQQYTYSYRQIDSEIPFTNDPEITVQDIPNNLNLGKPHYENILLTVVGNGT